MLKRFQDYIVNSTWEQLLEEEGRLLRRICWGVVAFAAFYFAAVSAAVIIRGPLG